jgi:hypothetical protein
MGGLPITPSRGLQLNRGLSTGLATLAMSVEVMLSPDDLGLLLFISLMCLFCRQTRRSVFGVIELEVFSKTLQFCFDLFA